MSLATRLWRSPTLRRWAGYEQTIWARKAADEAVRCLVRPLKPETLDALEISGRVWRDYGFKTYRSVSYPDFDVCDRALDEAFDLVIAEHVFEHLLWPYRAGRNVHAMVRPGGYFLMVAPFLYRVHRNPVDCSRWTPTGMQYFLAECGFPLEQVQVGSWGNLEAVEAHFRREYVLFNRHLHRMENDPNLPVVVWALARKAA